MKRIIFLLIILCQAMIGFAQKGIPFFINFGIEQYEAHSRNFSILCDSYGRVYVANFEGLLYYDQAAWHIIHTSGISRITVLYQDKQQRIWVGGYYGIAHCLPGQPVPVSNNPFGIKVLLNI